MNQKDQLSMNKSEFVNIINQLKLADDTVNKVNEIFRQTRDSLKGDFLEASAMSISHEDLVVHLLEHIFDDSTGWISYFLCELDYGKEYKDGCITENGKNVPLRTAEDLYDVLVTK